MSKSEAVVTRETPAGAADGGAEAIDLELPERPVALMPELVLPHEFYFQAWPLLDDTQRDTYEDVRGRLGGEFFGDAPQHRVCGLPDIVQNPMEFECQLASNGIYVGTPDAYDSPAARQLASGADDWRLLAQIDSDKDFGVMWGDCGTLFWWLREQDFATARFDCCWGVLQCY